MSPQNSKSNKRPAGIYEGLLFMSLFSMIVGIIFLVLKLGEYAWQVAP